MKKLDTNLAHLRLLAEETRSLLDVVYGTVAQDPVPMQLGPECVYSLIPYSVTKSRLFDMEFWFNLHTLPETDSLMMVGRRAFPGRTRMFAFTLESTKSMLRFSWNVPDGVIELGPVKPKTWYQVRVTAFAGETRLMLLERAGESETTPLAKVQEKISNAGDTSLEAALMLDRQLELRIGGAFMDGKGAGTSESWGADGAEELWDRISTLSQELSMCIFNIRLGGSRMSLVDLAGASTKCKRPEKIKCRV